MNNRFEITYHPATLKRQYSYFDLLDLATYDQSRYTFTKALGAGTYGYVRLFEDDDGNRIAVKALKPKKARHLTRDRVDSNVRDIQAEFNFLKQAYPDEPGYSLHLFEEPDVEEPELEIAEDESPEKSTSSSEKSSKPNRYPKGHPGIHASYRMTVPFIEGKNLCTFADEDISTQAQMAKLVLRLAEELQRIHDIGIIHADIGSRNVLVRYDRKKRDYCVHFIDFGMAYKKNGYATVNFRSDKETTKSGKKASSAEMAPERYPNQKLRAHPRQDVYSFAKTLNKMIKHRSHVWRKKFETQYPFIKTFITAGADKTPGNRPSLPEFIVRLKNHIDCGESLPESLANLVFALETDGQTEARKLMEAKSSCYTREKLTPALYQLIKNHAYDLVEKLMEMRKGIPLDKEIDGDHILALAAGDADMEDSLFASMLDYIPKHQLLTVICKQNDDGISALRGMAETGRLHFLVERIEQQPRLVNDLVFWKITDSTTRESAVLHLLAYLSKFKSEATDKHRHHLFKGKNIQSKKDVEKAVFYLIDQILMPSSDDGSELDVHETTITNNYHLSRLHQDLLDNNLIGSPREDSIFDFLPKLFG